jgi:predicted aspartyl protease
MDSSLKTREGSGEMGIRMTKAIRIVIDVCVNKVPLRFFLDTGATHTAIKEDVAKKLGLKAIGTMKVSGFKGSAKRKIVKAETISVNGQDPERDFLLWVHSEIDEWDGVLGMDFLKEYVLTIDYKNKELVLQKHPAADAEETPRFRVGDRVMTQAHCTCKEFRKRFHGKKRIAIAKGRVAKVSGPPWRYKVLFMCHYCDTLRSAQREAREIQLRQI